MSTKTIQEIRAFNRFYTDLIGLLNKHLLNSDYSLSEVRIMYEIHTAGEAQASQIMAAMDIDKSYLSRILKKLEKDQLIARKASEQDGRAVVLSLTKAGEDLFQELTRATEQQIGGLVNHLNTKQQEELVAHMQAIRKILQGNL
ncbi:MarR family winged helix-turn-helix transcriptional regulator [Chitinophaga silvisoli]|uniref:MarR family transcriptional regulator n=1 Tax=Chitinophaga silvisoli TaxID=2291814 RepID=A0A3E1P0F0_9BACT|nr:MarR family transcriptional regulator [Chitinophaga silvisoli]RFM33676.1 MarR family transcriptional regulator [Chitinophaga silvisoli]